MDCDQACEAVSADLDGEDHPYDRRAVESHLVGCAACRDFLHEATTLHRVTRVRPAPRMPDLTERIMAAVGTTRASPARLHWSRYALGALAATELLLALPVILMASGAEPGGVHVARETGGADLALAIGLLVAVIQPWRSQGLLPVAVALGVAVTATSVADLVAGRADLGGEAHHILELAGIVVLVILSRRVAPTPNRPALRAART